MSPARSFRRAGAALLLLGLSCAPAATDVPSPKLPPCPRVVGSVYKPGEPSPAIAASAAPSDVKEIVAASVAGGADAGAPSFARTKYSAVPRPPPAIAPVASCGDKKNPCPLQRWMRESMATALAANDGPKLANALDKMASFSPVPAWDWNAMAAQAAVAARRGDVAGARKSCQGCHNAYKNGYKEKFRTLPVR